MIKVDDKWKLEFQNGTSAFADIVIAADGANSKIRPFITSIKPFYTGFTAIEGSVYHSETALPVMHKLLHGGKIFAFGDEKSLIVSSKGDGSLVFYPAFKKEENWAKNNGVDFTDKAQVIGWFKNEFSGWSDVWLELFENAEPAFIIRQLYCMPTDQYWNALPDVTMIGDAAHLMPPYAGEGVNMAMLDALELNVCFTSSSFNDTKSAIEQYEKQMRLRASGIAEMSLDQTEILHSANAVKYMLDMFAGIA